MATGASTADLAILLVDARHGVRVQSRRHARIARLLGITDFVLAINKMDLVDFDRGVFDGICDDFEEIAARARELHAIPISALHGDNVITPQRPDAVVRRPEPAGVPRDGRGGSRRHGAKPFRFPVQLVLRPDQEFRGYAGQIVSGHGARRRYASRVGRPAAPPASAASSPGTATSRWHTRRCR